MNKTAKAFAPAAISSFFEICDMQNGKPIEDLTRAGARGGGFGLKMGTTTTVTVQEAEKSNIKVFINKNPVNGASTTRNVVEALLFIADANFSVTVEHQVDVPIGMGFGTSAGGALNAGLAMADALDLPLTYNQIGTIAHVAEIQCQTGLGTASSLTFGGECIIVTKPGAPGICQIDRIPLNPNYMIVAGFFDDGISKKALLSSPDKKQAVNRWGKKTMKTIQAEPSVENFLDSCLNFAQKTGFLTPRLKELAGLAKKAGAVGSAQNMVGEAIHSLVLEENADCVVQAFKKVLPSGKVIVSKLDSQGARLIN